MQLGGQALQVKMRPAVRGFQREDLMRQGAAGDQQDATGTGGRKAGFAEGDIIHQGALHKVGLAADPGPGQDQAGRKRGNGKGDGGDVGAFHDLILSMS